MKQRENAELRQTLLQDWQRQWDDATKGRWTYELIPKVEKWMSRGHGDIDHFITQALTGHGCFNVYLCKIKKLDSPQCSFCGAELNDAKHTLFECDAFEYWRRQLNGKIGQELNSGNIVDEILEGKWKWQLISTYISRVMMTKCDEERRRQAP